MCQNARRIPSKLDAGGGRIMYFLHRNSTFKVKRYHSESDYEAFLIPQMKNLFLDYHILPFKLNVFANSNYGNRQADLVMIHKEYRDWVVVEVELGHHSLNSHVFPQAYTFKNGEYSERHVEYLIGKKNSLDKEKLSFLLMYNPPRVLVIVDDEDVYERGWDRLEEVCKIGLGIPLRNENNDYAVYYTGWMPKSSNSTTSATWRGDFSYLDIDSPVAILQPNQERLTIIVNNRETEWIARPLRGGIVLFPTDSWMSEFLQDGMNYDLVKTDISVELIG